ncbi:hypothetical protein PV08_02436 [Exophiala spinifera]|uniref:BZIP domain-containing protein n=1 Tax=Exophiala spinifera TaxID=91928 RepID=A0A0D2BGM4_9EURO|nr:uncharacterized protein PV08_02436 [Exophiala spinifera]KIW18148.1 hypothetical protein PV08_02436 [Exophiala spinifera]
MASKSPKWLSKLSKPFSEAGPSSSAPSEDNSGQDARSRRREQVRRAQRTHRDRKASYLKMLEMEVAKLRAKDASNDAEIQAYKATIRRLKDLIKLHNLVLPDDLASDPLIQSPQAAVELIGMPDHHSQTIRAQLPQAYAYAPEYTAGASTLTEGDISSTFPPLHPLTSNVDPEALANMSLRDSADTGFDRLQYKQPGEGQDVADVSSTVPHPHGLGTTQIGVDFVLGLEYVCLEHHAIHRTDIDGSGHEMMLMSPIMRCSPPLSSQPTETGSGLPDGTKWTVPAVELEKLLEFSDRLSLDGEITPVEAWQRVRLHPKFPDLTMAGLDDIRAKLVPEVKCYGFGAVIDEAYFDSVISQIMGTYQGGSS